METSIIINGLIFASFGLLVAVTGGIGYLTAVEWRDRRRQEKDRRSQQKPGAKAKPSKK